MKSLFSILLFSIVYAVEVVRGGVRVAWDIFTPGLPTSPRIIEVPTPPMNSLSRLLLANLISMTPGSISVDHLPQQDGGGLLRIHLLYADTDAGPLLRALEARYLPLVMSLPKFRRQP